MPDVSITCVQCRENFVFTEKEQERFYQRNMSSPQRCPSCHSKKAKKSASPGAKFPIVCDNCGKHDTVTFQPKVGRPILCKECFQASRSRSRVA